MSAEHQRNKGAAHFRYRNKGCPNEIYFSGRKTFKSILSLLHGRRIPWWALCLFENFQLSWYIAARLVNTFWYFKEDFPLWSRKKEPNSVKHHHGNYRDVPLWVIINELEFGIC